MSHEKPRRVAHNCRAGNKFNYYCDDCALELFGSHSKNETSAGANGWTWKLTRNGEEIATAGNKLAQRYGGTENEALEAGLKRFGKEPCVKPN